MDKSKRTMRTAFRLLGACAVIGPLAACTAMADFTADITGDPNREIRSGIHWNTQVPEIYLRDAASQSVYFHLRNMSGEAPEDVQQMKVAIRSALQNKGYQLVGTPDAADFTIRGDMRYFGENPKGATSGSGLVNGVGATVLGLGVGAVVAKQTDSDLAGVGVGALAGSLASKGLNNASRVVEYTVVMDFFISERSEGNVKSVNTTSTTSQGDSTGIADGLGTRGGSRSDVEQTRQSMARKQNQYDHSCSMTAWANKIRCSRAEAFAALLPKLKVAVAEIMPDRMIQG